MRKISPLSAPSPSLPSDDGHIWALKDVSFEVKPGEVVGIIGRNGAGKSTLLKILSRITEPTAGWAEIHGRVGSLLEVGTGFHPELTGRENIYLNGAILGMKQREIAKKLEEIVAFAEVEKFTDTPVKHYSSGMFLRLAFAVAAHLEPEILMVDEVLAVGDAAFQRKCLGKMGDVAMGGRTVLFVSHNMGAVNQLCQRGIWIEKGRISAQGKVTEVVSRYLLAVTDSSGHSRTFPLDPSKHLQILSVAVTDETGQPVSKLNVGSGIYLDVHYQVHRPVTGANLAIAISRNGMDIFCSFDTDSNPQFLEKRNPGIYQYRVALPTQVLKAGLYSVNVDAGIINRAPIDNHRDAVCFRIEECEENTAFKGYAENRTGVLRLPVVWEMK